MSVMIGMASIDERGRAYGGAAGDQTGREVYILPWYAGGWNVLLRPKSGAVAEKMAAFCEAVCDNPRVGYDQYQRNTLRDAARAAGWDGAKISVSCETDCSAFMSVCAEAAGVDMNAAYTYGNAPVTWNMRQKFTATGQFLALTDAKYLTSDRYLRRGDVLVRESGHTVMVLGDGTGNREQVTSNRERARSYTVVPGDTLWGICQRFGVSLTAMRDANSISDVSRIYPGQVFVIPN